MSDGDPRRGLDATARRRVYVVLGDLVARKAGQSTEPPWAKRDGKQDRHGR
jgi:hypothetical protein